MAVSRLPAGVREKELLGRHTSLKVGGPADFFAEARASDELIALLRWADDSGIPRRIFGGGSNLLVADAGVEGLVVKVTTSRTEVVQRNGQPILVADAGVTFANVARKMSKRGFGGLEWAANVPGSVGGAVVNNAGAFGSDTASRVIAVTIVDASGIEQRLGPADLRHAYRTSVLKRRELGDVAVMSVELRLDQSTPEATQSLVALHQAQRTASQPRQLSAGSVFANPEGHFSGQLIEQVGLKGARLGGAQISTQHANFIVNLGGATAADVYGLMRRTQELVFEQSSIWLQAEIELLGRWSDEEREALRGPTVRPAFSVPRAHQTDLVVDLR
jgi:UDP-N-acetylmuramate dehydrogenase